LSAGLASQYLSIMGAPDSITQRNNNPQESEAVDASKTPPVPTSCLPKLLTPRKINFTSPRYFFNLTPRTKANVGEEDFTESLRQMRTLFPGHEDYDMVPFLRVTHVRSVCQVIMVMLGG